MNINNKIELMKKLGNTSKRLMSHHPSSGNGHIGRGQGGMLDIIVDNPGISQEELASKLDLDKTTVAKAVKKLEMHGMIKRQKSETDGRKFEIFAEAKATKIKADMRDQRELRCKLAFEGIDDDALAQFEKTLNKIEENIDNNNLDMRKKRVEGIKKILDIISNNPNITKDELVKDTKIPAVAFNHMLGGLEKRGLVESIDGEYFITEKGKSFDEDILLAKRRGNPHHRGARHHHGKDIERRKSL